ncbi:hypothetical protein [Bradyrhizobium sp. STM 3562]|uniref:hypothetical protein n=1 Tax=Bradyrhizobium sp. STM 3562 TaxID=578924 RepID=UPI00388DECF0
MIRRILVLALALGLPCGLAFADSISNPGTVTSVTCGPGLSGGTISSSGACAVSLSVFTNSIGANVSLSSTSTYFDGPSVAQGNTGTWLAMGQATVSGPSGDVIACKLWDGSSVLDSSIVTITAASATLDVHLSGYLSAPVGNLKISCKDSTSTSGFIIGNNSGTGKDSTVSVVRIN